MTKIFPIKIQRTIPYSIKVVDWRIHNVCNFNCSFCNMQYKDGSQRWFPLEKYKSMVDTIVKECEGAPLRFNITGGEPTLYPELLDLLKYIKDNGASTALLTNGIRTINWWKNIQKLKLLDMLLLTYHSEQNYSYRHIAEVVNLFSNDPTDKTFITCTITHVIDSLDKAFEAFNFLTENTGSHLNLFKAMVMQDIYKLYTEEQLQKVQSIVFAQSEQSKKIHNFIDRMNLIVTYSDGTEKQTNQEKILKDQENNFKDWSCNIGIDRVRIDGDIVSRGVCGVGGSHSFFESGQTVFKKIPIICTADRCSCGAEIMAKKELLNDSKTITIFHAKVTP